MIGILVFVLAFACGCGVGGGGILVAYLTTAAGYPLAVSQCVNLCLFIVSSLSSAAVQLFSHALPPARTVLFCFFCSLPGIVVGSVLRGMMDEGAVRAFFAVFLICAGAFSAASCLKKRE